MTSVLGERLRHPLDAGPPQVGPSGSFKSEFYAEDDSSVDGDLPDAAASEDGASEASTEDQRDVTPPLPADAPVYSSSMGQSRRRRGVCVSSSFVETDQAGEEEEKSAAAEAMALDVRAAGGWGRDGGEETGSSRWKREGPVPRSIFLPDYLDTGHHVREDKATPAPPTPKQQQLTEVRHGASGGRVRRKGVEGARVARHPQLEWRRRAGTIQDKTALVLVQRTIKKG